MFRWDEVLQRSPGSFAGVGLRVVVVAALALFVLTPQAAFAADGVAESVFGPDLDASATSLAASLPPLDEPDGTRAIRYVDAPGSEPIVVDLVVSADRADIAVWRIDAGGGVQRAVSGTAVVAGESVRTSMGTADGETYSEETPLADLMAGDGCSSAAECGAASGAAAGASTAAGFACGPCAIPIAIVTVGAAAAYCADNCEEKESRDTTADTGDKVCDRATNSPCPILSIIRP